MLPLKDGGSEELRVIRYCAHSPKLQKNPFFGCATDWLVGIDCALSHPTYQQRRGHWSTTENNELAQISKVTPCISHNIAMKQNLRLQLMARQLWFHAIIVVAFVK
jgi:hypothetical protein